MKIMGIINLTPDSFYSSSRLDSSINISRKINDFVNEGAEIIDVGAESSRPGSVPISEEEELYEEVRLMYLENHNVFNQFVRDNYIKFMHIFKELM